MNTIFRLTQKQFITICLAFITGFSLLPGGYKWLWVLGCFAYAALKQREQNTSVEPNSSYDFPLVESRVIRNGFLMRPARGPVLMLDVDGVLHPGQSGSLCYLPLLEEWLRENPVVDVVISSNWRDSHTFDELLSLFSADLQERVIGTTPNIEDGYREDEILALVRKYSIAHWAALDDREQEFPTAGHDHLVATEYLYGLKTQHLERLMQNLKLVKSCS